MQFDKNPLTPHLQIYRWHLSSLLSITHRIVGVINIISVTLICAWVVFLSTGESNYEIFVIFAQSLFGKFILKLLVKLFMYFLRGNPFLALGTPIRQWKWSKIAILCPFPVMGTFSITPLTQSLALQKASSMSILAHFVEISSRNFEN